MLDICSQQSGTTLLPPILSITVYFLFIIYQLTILICQSTSSFPWMMNYVDFLLILILNARYLLIVLLNLQLVPNMSLVMSNAMIPYVSSVVLLLGSWNIAIGSSSVVTTNSKLATSLSYRISSGWVPNGTLILS